MPVAPKAEHVRELIDRLRLVRGIGLAPELAGKVHEERLRQFTQVGRAADAQQLARRDEEPQVRARLDERRQLRRRIDHLLEVVDDEQKLASADDLRKLPFSPERPGDRRNATQR